MQQFKGVGLDPLKSVHTYSTFQTKPCSSVGLPCDNYAFSDAVSLFISINFVSKNITQRTLMKW